MIKPGGGTLSCFPHSLHRLNHLQLDPELHQRLGALTLLRYCLGAPGCLPGHTLPQKQNHQEPADALLTGSPSATLNAFLAGGNSSRPASAALRLAPAQRRPPALAPPVAACGCPCSCLPLP